MRLVRHVSGAVGALGCAVGVMLAQMGPVAADVLGPDDALANLRSADAPDAYVPVLEPGRDGPVLLAVLVALLAVLSIAVVMYARSHDD
jgi:hypothetical protein